MGDSMGERWRKMEKAGETMENAGEARTRQLGLDGFAHKEYRLHGCPGGGKSTALATSWIPKAVARFGRDGVTVCSLTKAAALEIGSRDSGLARERIGTLHALAYRALDKPTIAETCVDDWNKLHPSMTLTRTHAKGGMDDPLDLARDSSQGTGSADQMLARADILRHRLVPREHWPAALLQFQRLRDAWMKGADVIDFTGLIERALREVEAAPGDPAVLIVDEAQDSSRLELALVRQWAVPAEYLVLAGDSDQAIFAWRGATPDAFLQPEIDPDHNYHLRQSYRVPRAVHAAAEEWMTQATNRYEIGSKPRDFEGEVVKARTLDAGPKAHLLTARVRAYSEAGKTVMILAACGYLLDSVIKELRRQRVPFHNPYRPHAGQWNPARAHAFRFLALLSPMHSHLLGPDGPRWWTWYDLRRWTDKIKARGTLVTGAKAVIAERAGKTPRQACTADEVRELFEPAALDELRDAFAASDASPLAAVHWFMSRLTAATCNTKNFKHTAALIEASGVRSLLDVPRVIVGTIHSVKGGEADVVIVSPDLSPTSYAGWRRGGESNEEREGTVRMFYVAMTRARETLVLLNRATSTSITWKV